MALDDKTRASLAFFAVTAGSGAFFWWKGRQMAKPPLMGGTVPTIKIKTVDIPVKPIEVKDYSNVLLKDLTDEEKLKLGTVVSGQISRAKMPEIKPMLIRLSDKINLDYMRSGGLLGKLVAQHYASSRARAFYAQRCGAFSWDDDTPAWKNRTNQKISRSDVDKFLKDPKSYGAALSDKNFEDRWLGGKSTSNKWRRRYSMENTFSNWSAPVWFHGWPHTCFPESYQPCRVRSDEELSKAYKSFYYDGGQFGNYAFLAAQAVIFRGYQTSGLDYRYRDVYPKEFYRLENIPWRTFKGAGVVGVDRLRATYKMKSVVSNDIRDTSKRVLRYYTFGYNLLRAVMDVLCARKELASKFPGFAEHCTWWFIPQPTAEMLTRMDDLTVIGGGEVGLADVPSSVLVNYIMSITPKPGTIPPWEDKGPLWSWPESTGHMQPLTVGWMLKERTRDDIWGTIAQYAMSIESSLCSSFVGGAANVALNAALAWAETMVNEWVSIGMEKIMEVLDKILSNDVVIAVIEQTKEVIANVSAFDANISRFIDAENLVGSLVQGTNLPKALGEYLEMVADDVPERLLSGPRDMVKAQADSIRRTWDWADDLMGSAASMGSSYRKTLESFKGYGK